MVGESIQHYSILEKIGAGGMGVVYRAKDTRLDRQVVLKFLPEQACGNESHLERFSREARAASALNHPNICTIHDIGEHDGRPFIVMELLEGRTLRDLLGHGGVDRERPLDLATQVCDALVAAHAKGIVHRDIKPDNIFVVRGKQAKILDFGLAKLTDRPTDVDPDDLQTRTMNRDPELTRAGSTLGTAPYMSPEQARGREVDHRSDLFSLGAVLHEMVHGRRAFPGRTTDEIFDAILHRTPASAPADRQPGAGLQALLDKALEKDRDLRYQSAAELLTDLKRLRRDHAALPVPPSGEVVADARRVVAVLPFVLHSGKEEEGFLSVALAEAVSHELSGKAELRVRPTSAVLRYGSGKVDPEKVARDLGADVVVEGSIQKMAASLRVQVQAWEAASRTTLLSVKLDGLMDDLFGLQDRTAEALSRGLGIGPDSAPHASPTTNPKAYELLLRASERMLRYNASDTRRAIEMLRSAVELDPAFADGWAKLSLALTNMASLFDPDPDWYVEAERATSRALDLEPENAEAWTARGRILWSPHHGFQNAEAVRVLHRACCYRSHPPDAPLWLAVVLAHVGLHEQAVQIADRSIENHPDDLMALLIRGEALGWHGDVEAFRDAMQQTALSDTSFIYSYLFLPGVHLYLDELARAEQALAAAKRLLPGDALVMTWEALLWAKRGERDRSLQMLEQASRSRQSVSHLHHAQHYSASTLALLGKPLEAVEQLSLAVTTGFPNYVAFSRDPHLAPLREVEGFRQLLRKLRPTWEAYRTEFGELTVP